MTAVSQLARAVDCRYCARPIYVALCRDGRWRSFDRARVLPAPVGVWAWRKREGMEETDVAPGHRLHFCAEHGALGATFAGLPVRPASSDQPTWSPPGAVGAGSGGGWVGSVGAGF